MSESTPPTVPESAPAQGVVKFKLPPKFALKLRSIVHESADAKAQMEQSVSMNSSASPQETHPKQDSHKLAVQESASPKLVAPGPEVHAMQQPPVASTGESCKRPASNSNDTPAKRVRASFDDVEAEFKLMRKRLEKEQNEKSQLVEENGKLLEGNAELRRHNNHLEVKCRSWEDWGRRSWAESVKLRDEKHDLGRQLECFEKVKKIVAARED
ncbi:unnamed protein product [Periconia digitata]|uniref:Uncharacterized protein n=1 Tax=Periconia digitata TaxID=1303443 RepID=A0A9W4XVN0_9PLEO|nr:unnamed protein product [Periconia digitata]